MRRRSPATSGGRLSSENGSARSFSTRACTRSHRERRPWPYHWHHDNEELLIIVAGRPTLRTPEGERELAPGDSVLFWCGPDGAHRLASRDAEPARILILSTRRQPEIVEYPDSGKVGAASRHGRAMFPKDAVVDYWAGE